MKLPYMHMQLRVLGVGVWFQNVWSKSLKLGAVSLSTPEPRKEAQGSNFVLRPCSEIVEATVGSKPQRFHPAGSSASADGIYFRRVSKRVAACAGAYATLRHGSMQEVPLIYPFWRSSTVSRVSVLDPWFSLVFAFSCSSSCGDSGQAFLGWKSPQSCVSRTSETAPCNIHKLHKHPPP